MLDYLQKEKETGVVYTYTIVWSKKGEEGRYTSYFRGTNEKEVINKFLHEKNKDDYNFEITQNPLS